MDNVRRSGLIRAVEPESRKISFRASTPDLDRHESRVLPEGISTDNYDKNPIFLWGHDGYPSMTGGPSIESVIGRTIKHSKTKKAFDIDVEFAPADVNPKAEMAYRLTKAKFLNAVSIGFSPLEWHEEKSSDHPWPVIVYDSVDLLEVSLVPIPSNSQATALSRAIAGDMGMLDDMPDSMAELVERWLKKGNAAASGRRDLPPSAQEFLDKVFKSIDEYQYVTPWQKRLCNAIDAHQLRVK